MPGRLPPDGLRVPVRCLIVIPAYNEASTIAGVIGAVRKATDAPVLVVCDACEDDTAARALAMGTQVLDLPVRLGAWGAIQAGLRFGYRHGFEQVLTLDADGQHPADALPELRAGLDHADVTIGTYPDRLSVARRIAWWYFRALTGLNVVDVTSGMRGYGPRALALLVRSEASLLDYQDVGVLMLLSGQGMSIAEIPVIMKPRQAGHSRVFNSWFQVARYMIHTTVLCVARIRRRLPLETTP